MRCPYDPKENEQAWTAWQCLTRTNVNVFLTGKAGTGKTTFLKNLREASTKSMVIMAPTGVAAINAGGVTIHSLLQIPPGTYTSRNPLPQERTIRKDKLKLIRSLDLIVIDEISMVRADLMDAVDKRLREMRHSRLPFGGIQLLLIGDLMQLSPVVKRDEVDLLRDEYSNCYFFSSHAISQTKMVTIELKKIYRQSDATFIDLLNKVRTCRLDDMSLAMLNSRYRKDFEPDDSEGYIRLTTHVESAERVNESKIKLLKTKEVTYKCSVEGTFDEKNYPAEAELTLKVGAQVMFIKNDTQTPRRYYNGKIASVVALDDDSVTVKSADDAGEEIKVGWEKWNNVNYVVDPETGLAKEEIKGVFTQIPLTLAWAITIHKSQGLTFDKAIIDAGRSFSPGQVYVALSRCRSFEGLVLSSTIDRGCVRTNHDVDQFYNQQSQNIIDASAIEQYAAEYSLASITELFTFESIFVPVNQMLSLLEREGDKYANSVESLNALLHEDADEIARIGETFIRKCQFKHTQTGCIEKSDELMAQAARGAAFFDAKIADFGENVKMNADITLDDKTANNRLDNYMSTFVNTVKLKRAILQAIAKKGFSPSNMLAAKALALSHTKMDDETEVGTPTAERTSQADANEVVNKELFLALRKWRKEKAEEEDVPPYIIANNSLLFAIADTVPTDTMTLKKIKGMGKKKMDSYGDDILEITRLHAQMGVKPAIGSTSAPTLGKADLSETGQKAKKLNTREISLEAFNRLGSIDAVMQERHLTRGTIVGHLIDCIGEELTIDDVMGKERHEKLKEIVSNAAPDWRPDQEFYKKFTYGEINYVRREVAGEI